jgi:hypothetical protein
MLESYQDLVGIAKQQLEENNNAFAKLKEKLDGFEERIVDDMAILSGG